jgi:hypothetical protein
MITASLRWWVWLLLIFLVMMLAQDPGAVWSAGTSGARTAYHGAGAADKGLRGVETCGSACHSR